MKKFKLPITIDIAFVFIALFFVFYAVYMYVGLNVWITLALSLISALSISGAITVCLIKFDNKKYYAKLNTELLNSTMTAFIFMPRDKLLNFFADFYKNDGLYLEIINDGILIKDKNLFIYPIFKYEKISTEDIISAYRKTGNNRLIILAPKYSSEAIKLCSNTSLNITLFSDIDIFTTLKNADTLPKISDVPQNVNPTIKNKLNDLFNKKYSKFFFISGIVSLFTSTFTYFSIYYIIWGSIFLIISAVIKLFAPENKKIRGIKL